MVSLDIPTYFNDESIEFFKVINKNAEENKNKIKISHVYGSVSGLYSARETRRLIEVSSDIFENHIKKLNEMGIDFYYALNTSCLGALSEKEINEITNVIKKIEELGVKNFIIAHPFLIKLIKENIKDSKIKASVILEIDNFKTFKYFVDKVDIINISTKINRDFRMLDSLKKYKNKIELLCNEVCLYNCPFRFSHYTIESHRYFKSENYCNYPVDLCYKMMTNEELLISRFILPEWIDDYVEYANYFKLSGRTFPMKFIFRAAYHYSNKKSSDNILDLFPIVTGSLDNEINGVIEKRYLKMTEIEKRKFIEFFKYNGQNCKYKCPCGFCKTFEKCFKEYQEVEC